MGITLDRHVSVARHAQSILRLETRITRDVVDHFNAVSCVHHVFVLLRARSNVGTGVLVMDHAHPIIPETSYRRRTAVVHTKVQNARDELLVFLNDFAREIWPLDTARPE